MRLFFALLIVITAAGLACGSDDDGATASDEGDEWLAYVPLAPGAEEVERRVEEDIVSVKYETEATLSEVADHYRTSMSVVPWRVTTFDANYAQGSALLIFRSDEDGLIATTRINGLEGEPTTINLDVLPIVTRTPIATATESPE